MRQTVDSATFPGLPWMGSVWFRNEESGGVSVNHYIMSINRPSNNDQNQLNWKHLVVTKSASKITVNQNGVVAGALDNQEEITYGAAQWVMHAVPL
ncbi:hypothetical protein C2E20_1051 [Micractinium conductrix]|uniref:Uncharacterized protein n=1 Tax=Micractinium conductrix TaxID=554055 RepID=A0A2P6VP92_9CHLO|nr:hypothetical protein C2E20_1051 [Micractinium conductrix]|eukprot:PSC75911.1 hypothetical protein C2E20_1051 [Micractinium conductrix]